jgi:hypothetical protein
MLSKVLPIFVLVSALLFGERVETFYGEIDVDPQDADILVKFRCRGIDPWVYYHGQIVRLTMIDTQLGRELDTLRKQAAEGWPIKLYSEHPDDYFGP